MKTIHQRGLYITTSIIIFLSLLSSINAFQGSDVGSSCRNYNCVEHKCSHHAPQTNLIRRSINSIIQYPHLTTPTILHAFRGSDYNSNNNFGEDDDDDVDEDDEPPKLDTSPQEFLYRMQQRESQNKSSDSTSDDDSSTNNNNDSILSAPSYGPGRGRSTPQIRSAFGANKKNKSSSFSNNIKRGAKGDSNKDMTTVHVCTNCGAEYIQWRGQCSTCLEWNTIQEYTARRKPSSSGSGNSKMKPIFGKQQQGKFSQKNSGNSWLDGINDYSHNPGGGGSSGPVRVTDVYQDILSDDESLLDAFQNGNYRERRTLVPDDSELNTVLGGGIMPGSICLVGGDPGMCYFVCSLVLFIKLYVCIRN